jgi:tetratricopeptide (TPR) repeat protein
MHYRVSKIVPVVALLVAVSMQAASAQTAPIDRNRAEKLYPLAAWAKDVGQAGSILGDVAQALGVGTGDEVATLAIIYRDTSGLQYSFHLVKDRPDIMIMIRSTPDIADSWKIVANGAIEHSVHVDEHDKVSVRKFQPRLFDETLDFFRDRLREANRAAPVPAALPGETPAAAVAIANAALSPANGVAALIARGTQFNLASNYDRAIADFTEAIRQAPNSAQAYYGRAAVYYNIGDYDRAIQDYDQVLRIDPRNSSAVTFRALTLEMKNQH